MIRGLVRHLALVALVLFGCGRIGFESTDTTGTADSALASGSCGAISCACSQDCDVECLTGRCKITCEFSDCTIRCNAAPCDILCNAGNCNYECGAGGCTVRVIFGGDAIGTCTQNCTESCDATASTCMQTCDVPSTCSCSGGGCP